ncbi:MAG: hypothetical protein KY466_13935 [Gemmatimonadetes bacterium]|nr:hypothetical protein [Gemmatimonadota bacterium]
MTVLMSIASVVAAAVFLTILALGLLLIVKPLQSVRGYLEQIAMGVRAIETHAQSIPHGLAELTERLEPLGEELGRAAERLDEAGRALASRGPGE